MTRLTVDYGIDLGTTNSTAALLKGADVEVFKNNENQESTPSAIWIDKAGRLIVGRRAKEKLEDDADNAACEFKLQMGTAAEKVFARNGRRLRPEELSAEVLKSLKNDARQRTGEDMMAAVITVPAAFELPQCEATKKAGQLAGFQFCPLLQEPVAAALAYGFQSTSDKVFWLVYDLGGGTFDAAVIHMRDGSFQVVNHGDDNHLGGKLIDWAIVDQLLVPAATGERPLADFRRGNPRWATAMAKLKLAAEEAKIAASRDASVEICIDYLCQDDRGNPVRFEYSQERSDVERIAEPFVKRSINICRKIIAEKKLGPGDFEKVLLVGGPTLSPLVRRMLPDVKDGLGIPLEFGIDPLTVVARGAAIFAGTQRVEGVSPVASQGRYVLELDYKPVGADVEPLMGGKVRSPDGRGLQNHTIEFVNAESRPPWRSGQARLGADGVFFTTLWAQKGRPNTFVIELRDSTGTRVETAPDRVVYTVGRAPTDPPLIHSIGLALRNNETAFFFRKGASLPARKRDVRKVAVDVQRGHNGHLIRIPVVEGENARRADRNRVIGALVIPAEAISRDVPAGSEIEVTIEIDASRIVTTRAYIPLLDQDFEEVLKLTKDEPDLGLLGAEVARERERLDRASEQAKKIGDPRALAVLDRIEQERMRDEVDNSLAAAKADRDAADVRQNRLLDLMAAIDEVEDALEWPALVAKAETELDSMRQIVNQHGPASEKQNAASLEREVRDALRGHDADLIRRKIGEVTSLIIRVLWNQPEFLVAVLRNLDGKKGAMSDRARADLLFTQAIRALNNADVPSLKTAVQQLFALLPIEIQDQIQRGAWSSSID